MQVFDLMAQFIESELKEMTDDVVEARLQEATVIKDQISRDMKEDHALQGTLQFLAEQMTAQLAEAQKRAGSDVESIFIRTRRCINLALSKYKPTVGWPWRS